MTADERHNQPSEPLTVKQRAEAAAREMGLCEGNQYCSFPDCCSSQFTETASIIASHIHAAVEDERVKLAELEKGSRSKVRWIVDQFVHGHYYWVKLADWNLTTIHWATEWTVVQFLYGVNVFHGVGCGLRFTGMFQAHHLVEFGGVATEEDAKQNRTKVALPGLWMSLEERSLFKDLMYERVMAEAELNKDCTEMVPKRKETK